MASLVRTRSHPKNLRTRLGLGGVGRRTLGLACLLLTVFLWTASNFLASVCFVQPLAALFLFSDKDQYIFSDSTYDKPFFLLYINTSVFAINLIPGFVRFLSQHGITGVRAEARAIWTEHKHGKAAVKPDDDADGDDEATARERLLVEDEQSLEGLDPHLSAKRDKDERLTFRETAILSLEFSMLWSLANYFASACLQYTSVGSVTILTSTSSVWTLVFCAAMRIESFTVRKLVGVLASLAGVVLISTVDLSGRSDKDRGSFPHKSTGEIALGDAMAFLSAIIYGLYVTVMKRKVGNEERVDMQLFFGLVGVLNLVLLWPMFFVLHWTGIETVSPM